MITLIPCITEEIAAQPEDNSSYFGLLRSNAEAGQEELHGYEVTMSGKLVLPELRLQSEADRSQVSNEIAC